MHVKYVPMHEYMAYLYTTLQNTKIVLRRMRTCHIKKIKKICNTDKHEKRFGERQRHCKVSWEGGNTNTKAKASIKTVNSKDTKRNHNFL